MLYSCKWREFYGDVFGEALLLLWGVTRGSQLAVVG